MIFFKRKLSAHVWPRSTYAKWVYEVTAHNRAKLALYLILLVYIAVSATAVVYTVQSIGWDAALNIKMTDNGFKNIPFNHYSHPKPGDLNKDEMEFVAWWSPGQFALPLFIKNIFSVRLNIAIKLLCLFCLFISGLGIYKLYKQLISISLPGAKNSASLTALLLLLFTLFQPFFWANLFTYDGGGILMLAYCPWFIYFTAKIKHTNICNLVILLILAYVGFFLKAAFTSIFMGALLYLFFSGSLLHGVNLKREEIKAMISNALFLGLVFLIYFITIKFAFLSHNRNIGDSSLGIRAQIRTLAFPIAAPVFALFSLDFLNKTIYWIIGCAIIIPCYYLILKSTAISLLYKHILLAFTITCIAFYALLYFMNVDVSYENRHYTIIAILLTPAVFKFLHHNQPAKYFLYSALILYTLLNIYRYTEKINQAFITKPHISSYSGLPTQLPADVLDKIHRLDNLNDHGTDIFYFQVADPGVALEIRNNRVLLEDNFVNFHFNNDARLKQTLYYGRNAGQIYLICPLKQFKKDSALYLTRFEQYKKFDKIYNTDSYAIFKAIAN